MSTTTDILIAIDAQTLVEQNKLSQNQGAPTSGLNDYVYMITKAGAALSGNGGAELNISANIGDNIRWRCESASANFEYSVMFYNFNKSQGADLLSDMQVIGGVNSEGHVYSRDETIAKQDKSGGYWVGQQEECPYYFYQATCEDTGQVTYQFWFQINRTSDGALMGYGQWDPFITIAN